MHIDGVNNYVNLTMVSSVRMIISNQYNSRPSAIGRPEMPIGRPKMPIGDQNANWPVSVPVSVDHSLKFCRINKKEHETSTCHVVAIVYIGTSVYVEVTPDLRVMILCALRNRNNRWIRIYSEQLTHTISVRCA